MLSSYLKDIYNIVSQDDSLSLDQFVDMCISNQCNNILSNMFSRVCIL